MQNYFTSVTYNSERYNTIGSNILQGLINYNNHTAIKGSSDGNYVVSSIAKYVKTEEIVTLKLGNLLFKVKDSKFDGFEEEWKDSIYFNTTTLEGFADLDVCNKYKDFNFDDLCMLDVASYLTEVAKNNNAVLKYLESAIPQLYNGRNYYGLRSQLVLMNILRLTTTNLIEVEKMITSGNQKLLELLFKRENGKLEKGKKINQVIDLPKFAIDYIKDNELESAEEYIRLISEEFDGNTVKIIFDMLDAFNSYKKKERVQRYGNSKTAKKKEFIEIIYSLLKRDYKITTLLNYLLKQRMYWSKDNVFNIPYEEARLMRDFIKICEDNSLKYEKYPQDLPKMHDIVLKNISVLNDDKVNKKFIDMISKYHLKDIEVDDFIFTVPKDIHDLVKEGNDLHHCIGSYVDNIVNGISEIYFMRLKNNPTQSFVTVELNPTTKKIVEFKEDYNKEPTNLETIDAVKKFEKIKKPKTK